MDEPTASPKSTSSAVDKALDLVEAVVGANRPVRLADLARDVGMHRATAYRVLVDLVRRGWVQRSGDRYLPGAVILQMSRVGAADTLVALARPVLQSLSDATSMMANLQVLEPDGSRVVDVVRPPRLEMITDLHGAWLAAHRFAGPLALVAALPPATRVPYLNVAEQAGYPTDGENGLVAEIERTRRDGYALVQRRNDHVVASISRVARHPNGVLACALTVVGLNSDFDDAKIAQLKDALADAIGTLEALLADPPADLADTGDETVETVA